MFWWSNVQIEERGLGETQKYFLDQIKIFIHVLPIKNGFSFSDISESDAYEYLYIRLLMATTMSLQVLQMFNTTSSKNVQTQVLF